MHRASYRFMPPCGITETLSDVESVRVVHSSIQCISFLYIENRVVFADEMDRVLNPILSDRVVAFVNGEDLKENPDIEVIFDGVIKMICEGRSDVDFDRICFFLYLGHSNMRDGMT